MSTTTDSWLSNLMILVLETEITKKLRAQSQKPDNPMAGQVRYRYTMIIYPGNKTLISVIANEMEAQCGHLLNVKKQQQNNGG